MTVTMRAGGEALVGTGRIQGLYRAAPRGLALGQDLTHGTVVAYVALANRHSTLFGYLFGGSFGP